MFGELAWRAPPLSAVMMARLGVGGWNGRGKEDYGATSVADDASDNATKV